MKNPWDHFWYRPCAPHALALTRIAVALYILCYALLYAPHIPLLFSAEGLVLPLFADAYPQFAPVLMPPSVPVAYALFALCIAAIIFVLLGAFHKFSLAIVIGLSLYFWQLQLHLFPTSYNRIVLLVLVVLFWSGASRTFSVDQWRRSGSPWNWEYVSILPQRLIALQVSITFLGVSLQKWWLPQWDGGEVLSYAFLGMWGTGLAHWYARLPFDMSHYDFLVLVVKILQPLAAVGLWLQRFRFASFLFIAGFIVMVSTMLSIWWFIYVIPTCILFWAPEDVLNTCRKQTRNRISQSSINLAK